jgi:hypothetical protein
MRHALSLAIFVACLQQQVHLSFSSSSSSSSNLSSDGGDERDGDLCGMYLAPSTIPGAGLGVFAGHFDIAVGENLLTDDGDLVVPIYEMTKHVGHEENNLLWWEYTWQAISFDGMFEEVEDVNDVKACSTGLGAAINCILPLVNIVDDYDEREVGLSGIALNSDKNDNSTATTKLVSPSLSSPGVGAFTPYHNRRWKAKQEIPAGMELYGNYGQGYFTSRTSYDTVPLKKNYKQVDNLLKQFQTITSDSSRITEQQKTDLLVYLQSLSEIWDDSRNMHAIPQTDPPGDAGVVDWLLRQTGGSGMIHYNSSIRDLDWLQEHGRCMDNIRDGISRIPHAGRGAFARRAIPEGSVVAPAPLIQVPDRGVLTIYDKKRAIPKESNNKEAYEFVADHDKPIHHQLLLNYCFGHNESSLLLCPYGLMTSHINHDATNPNTKIVWANDNQMDHPEWRAKSIEEWGTWSKAGLSFNFLALRNIAQDEEITIDYGSEWEKAWQKHVDTYYKDDQTSGKSVNDSTAGTNREAIEKYHVPAFELNKLVDLKLQTMEEGDYESQGLRLFCRKPYLDWSGAAAAAADGVTVIVWSRMMANKNKSVSLKLDWGDNKVYPCRIRNRYRVGASRDLGDTDDSHEYRYFAEVFERLDDEVDQTLRYSKDVVWAALFDVPRDAFYFEDQKNHRHHHQMWSFRHDMRIPDDIFPDVWRNSKKN